MKRFALSACSLIAVFLLAGPAAAGVLVDCYAGSPGGDSIHRGFYVDGYPGSTLGSVDMLFSSLTSGSFTIRLTAHAGTYDGPVVGQAEVSLSLTADAPTMTPATFDFADAPTTPGRVLAFTMEYVEGPDMPLFGVLTDNVDCPVVETETTAPPLSVWHHDGVRVRIDGNTPTPVAAAGWGQIKRAYR